MRSLIHSLLRLLLLSLLTVGTAFAEGHGEGAGDKSKAAGEYMAITPALITNYGGPGPIHFLKAEITLRLDKNADASDIVTHHMPRIRHELIMLLTRQTEENLESMEGKEQLRRDALTTVQKLLESESGKKCVEDVLFTNFVTQH